MEPRHTVASGVLTRSGAAITIALCYRVFRLTRLCTALQQISSLNSWQTTLGTDYVGPVCISKLFSILFNVNLTDSSRVKAVINGYGKDHPTQTRWKQDQTWNPGCVVAYWAKQPGFQVWSCFQRV